MRRLPALWLLLLGVIPVGPSTVHADPPAGWQTVILADYPLGQATDTRICSLGMGLSTVCWRDPTGQVCTRSRTFTELGPVVVHGPGSDPVVFGDLNGYYLAYASGTHLVVRPATSEGAWGPPITLDSGFGVSTHHPDFCYAGSAWVPCLAWLEGSRVIFTSRQAGGWSPPEVAATDAANNPYPGLQVEPAGSDVRPRIYYQDLSNGVVYRERSGPDAWTSPVPWPATDPDIYWPFRVTSGVGSAGRNAMIHLGIPPTCPCGNVYFARETGPGTWAPPQQITVDGAAYDFPRQVSICTDLDGNAQCFWNQAFFDQGLNLVGERMYYRVFYADGSSSEPWTFDSQVGTYNDLDYADCWDCGSGPDFCWIESLPGGGTRVVELRSMMVGGVSDPRLEAGLTVVPNPASGPSTITWSLPQPEPARVEIFDAAGRLVRAMAVSEGQAPCVSWDGRTANGVAAPSGSYLVRLVTSRGSVSRTVTRIR